MLRIMEHSTVGLRRPHLWCKKEQLPVPPRSAELGILGKIAERLKVLLESKDVAENLLDTQVIGESDVPRVGYQEMFHKSTKSFKDKSAGTHLS